MLGLLVEPLAQVLAGLEEGDELLGHGHGGTRARVAADAGGPMLDGEGAEAAQLHPVTPRQRLDDLVEDDVDDALDIPVIKVLVGPSNLLNELGLDHRSASQPPMFRQKSLYCLIFPNPAKPIPGR